MADNVASNEASVVGLNVGGKKYDVALSTIQKYPESMLATLVSERWESRGDKGGESAPSSIFIDRDPEKFG